MGFKHVSVLLNESIDGLNIKKDGIYVDGTLGGGGHTSEILKKLNGTGLVIGVDRDIEAIKASKERLKEYSNIKYIHGNHDELKQILENENIENVDGILLDLGVSSYQIDEKNRGFSYMQDGVLDMRMDLSSSLTAKEVVNTYDEEKLANIIYEYGEEKFSRQIARKIVEKRKIKVIETTEELKNIIEEAIPKKFQMQKMGHPAKKTFQAIRIEVNNEIEPLYNTVIEAIKLLKKGGRLCIITFHSLEDRAVKKAYTDALGKCTCPKGLPYCVCNKEVLGKIVNKKPILPKLEEQEKNTRSKSAKLRIFERN